MSTLTFHTPTHKRRQNALNGQRGNMPDLDSIDRQVKKDADKIYMLFALTVAALSLLVIAIIMLGSVFHFISIDVYVGNH
jgi:hypothetical protein